MPVFSLQSVSAEDRPEDIGELAVAAALSAGDWEKAAAFIPPFLEKSPQLKERLGPALAWAFFKTGRNADALKIIEGRADAASLLVSGTITNKEVSLPGIKEPVKSSEPFFVEISSGAAAGEVNLGVFPRKAFMVALKKAFYALLPEPSVKQVELFESKIAPNSGLYFLAGDILFDNAGKMVCIAFIDTGRLSGEFGLQKKAKAVTIGILTRKGGDDRRKALVKELSAFGFTIEDFGRGDYYALGDRKKLAGIVMELNEETRIVPLAIKSGFKHIEGSLTLAFYNASTDETLAELKEHSSIVHTDEERGRELAAVKGYEGVSSRLKDTLSELSKKVEWRLGGLPPLEAAIVTEKVFSNNYKFYAKGALGEITLKNNTDRPVTGVRLIFSVINYMDFPTQTDLGDIPARQTVKKEVNAVFNNKILDITEDTFIQSEAKLTYAALGKEDALTLTHPVYFYERHALNWDDKGKIASFVTPKDPVIMTFATQTISGYRDVLLSRNLVAARALFEALGVMGLAYAEDPNNPYQIVSDLTSVIDFVQFPRETLARKAGDCDDLTSLYASLLESVGIKTVLLDAPGHIYLMFDTGVDEDDRMYFGFPAESVIIKDGSVWVPVETTLVGSSFSDAWKKGIEEFSAERERTRFIDLREAWPMHNPPTLPAADFEAKVTKDEIEKRHHGELRELENARIAHLTVSLERLGPPGLKELMIVFGRDGLLDRAMDAGKRLLETGRDAAVLNNMGNIYYLKGDMANAVASYAEAASIVPGDAGIWVNLSRAHLKAGPFNRKDAKEAFEKAMGLDPKVRERHVDIFMELQK